MKWLKSLSWAWIIAGLSLMVNVALWSQNNQLSSNFVALEQRLDQVNVKIEIYNGDNTVIKTINTLSIGAQTLGEVLEDLDEQGLLTVELSGASEWGRYIISFENITEESTYWAIFSSTNVACAGQESFDGTLTDYCTSGIDTIQVLGGDQFTFKLLGY